SCPASTALAIATAESTPPETAARTLISRSSAGPDLVPRSAQISSLPTRAASTRARSCPAHRPDPTSSLGRLRSRRSPLALRALALAHVPLIGADLPRAPPAP